MDLEKKRELKERIGKEFPHVMNYMNKLRSRRLKLLRIRQTRAVQSSEGALESKG